MLTTLTHWRKIALALAVAGGVCCTSAAASGEASARPSVSVAAGQDPVALALALTRARTEGRWEDYVRLQVGAQAPADKVAEAALVLGQQHPGDVDPAAHVEVVAHWDEAPQVRVWVRVTGRELHTWEWIMDRAGGRWIVREHDRDPGGDPMPST